jgi:N-acyl-L-homoserine lactone synthetase
MQVRVMTPACPQRQSRAGRAGSPADPIVLVAAERDEVYAGLMLSPAPSAEPPTAPNTWEWTLWRSAAAQCELTHDEARWSLIVGALEFAEGCGVGAFRMQCEADFLPQLVELGWEPRPLGLPRRSGAGAVIEVTWRVCPGHLEGARARLEAARTVGRRSLARMDVVGCA